MKKIVVLWAFTLSFCLLSAQNIYHPWFLSAGTNFADFNAINKPFAEIMQSTNWMGKKAPTMLRLGRHVMPGFSVSFIYTSLTLETDKLNAIPLEKTITDSYFAKAGVQAEYRLANGKLLKDAFFIDPYIFTGFSMSWIDEQEYPGIPAGFGVNIWPIDYLGVNFQASYEYLFDFDDYFHYSIGIAARFGNMIDKDRDMIADRYDACPEIWGLECFDGCPDYDHDGVVDSLDQCPKEHGWPPANGCPDFDKDGIPDKEDACPCVAGSRQYNGCPDSPEKTPPPEALPEPVKQAPSQKEKQNQGRKTSQITAQFEQQDFLQDTLPDSKQQPATIDDAIDPLLDNIHFEANSAAIKNSSFASLDKILEIMKQNPAKSFTIQGYPEVSEPGEYSLFLSEVRAKSIKEYLVKKGISSARLDARGFGEIDVTYPNRNDAGMAKKRRVEIYMK